MSGECTVYTIGGWLAGDEANFLQSWKPIFEQYLTSVVGAMYEPPVSFTLVAADFQEQKSFARMIADNQLDIVCKFFQTYCTYTPVTLNDLCVWGQMHLLVSWRAWQKSSDLCRLQPNTR